MKIISTGAGKRASRGGYRSTKRAFVGLAAVAFTLTVAKYAYGFFFWYFLIIVACSTGPAPMPTGVTGSLLVDPVTHIVTYDLTIVGLAGGDTVAGATVEAGVDTVVCDASGSTTIAVLDPSLSGTYVITQAEQDAMVAGDHIIIVTTVQGRTIWIWIGKIPPPGGIPAASQWGLACMSLMLLAVGTYVFRRRKLSAVV
ncbi:MAG: IPTL-CTERM sorting domain-containing protein [Phycisphaerae bacterium]